jgi:tetratricopeptide (TPR) repeat protein
VSGCARHEPKSERRIAILHFEDLSSGGGNLWVGAALAAVTAAKFTSERDFAFAAPTLQDARLRYATHTVQGYLAGPGQLKVAIRDEAQRKTTGVAVVPFADPLQASEPLIRALGGTASPYTTTNVQALHARWRSELAEDIEEAQRYVAEAISADPNFGAAHLQKIELIRRSGDRSALEVALGAASAPEVRYTPGEAAQLAALRAELAADIYQSAKATLAYARAQRSDPAVWLLSAERLLLAKQPGEAALAIGQAIRYQPESGDLWNQLGYAQAFAGNFDQAAASLRRYAELAPQSPNPLDSLGEVHFLFKRFEEAEGLFLQAAELDRNFFGGQLFLRAALAAFLAGDLKKADDDYKKYVEVRRALKDPLLPVRTDLWLNATGRREGAESALSEVLAQPHTIEPVRVGALSVRSLWRLSAGDRTAAAEAARQALQIASPANRLLPTTAAFLASPSSGAAAWEERAMRTLPAPELVSLRDQLLAWALLLDGFENESVAVWKRVWARTPPLTGAEVSAGYAVALEAAGQKASIAKLLPPLQPLPVTDPGWSTLLFPRVLNVIGR